MPNFNIFKKAIPAMSSVGMGAIFVGANYVAFREEERRITKFQKDHPGDPYKMEYQKVPGAMGYWYPVADPKAKMSSQEPVAMPPTKRS